MIDSRVQNSENFKYTRAAMKDGKIKYRYYSKESGEDYIVSESCHKILWSEVKKNTYTNSYSCTQEQLSKDRIERFNSMWSESHSYFGETGNTKHYWDKNKSWIQPDTSNDTFDEDKTRRKKSTRR